SEGVLRLACNIYANDCKIAVLHLENVWAAVKRCSHHSVRMRIRPNASFEHARLLTIVRCDVKPFFDSLRLCARLHRHEESLLLPPSSSKKSDFAERFR